MMMAAREQMKNDGPPVKRNRKKAEEKALLDSTKHLNYDGPNQKGMTKPLKPIPVFKQVFLTICASQCVINNLCRGKVNTRGHFTIALIKPSKA